MGFGRDRLSPIRGRPFNTSAGRVLPPADFPVSARSFARRAPPA